jgi:beta-lactamase regulating signal transducer with metallopeptidase domain
MFMADDAADIAATPADLMSVPAATTVTVLWAVAAILAAAVVFARRDIGARQAVTE